MAARRKEIANKDFKEDYKALFDYVAWGIKTNATQPAMIKEIFEGLNKMEIYNDLMLSNNEITLEECGKNKNNIALMRKTETDFLYKFIVRREAQQEQPINWQTIFNFLCDTNYNE